MKRATTKGWLAAMLIGLCAPVLAADHAVILLYHHVDESTPASTSVSPALFEAHLRHLEEQRFAVWPLTRIIDHIAKGKPLPERTVAITFDDAYRSVYTEAYPRLRQRGWPFTVFVATDYIDRGYAPYMSWAQLREVNGNGGEIGNHSRSHAHLLATRAGESQSAWAERVRAEMTGAQQRLRAELGKAAALFAYPYGEYDRRVQDIARSLHYYGLGQHSGAIGPATDLLAIPRFPMAGRHADLDNFAQRVRSRPLPVTVLEPGDGLLTGDERARLRLRLGAGNFSAERLACYDARGETLPWQWLDRKTDELEVRSRGALPAGRSKFTCTAPDRSTSGVYHWFSFLWIKPSADGSFPE